MSLQWWKDEAPSIPGRFPLDAKASLGFDSHSYLSNRNHLMSKRNTPQRRHAILALLAEQGEVSVDQLAKAFDTSEVTIRKDLTALEKSGLLLRRYGGAVPMPHELISEPSQPLSPYKQAIAAAAAGCHREHARIII